MRAGFGRRRNLRCADVLSGRLYDARCSVQNFRMYGVRDALIPAAPRARSRRCNCRQSARQFTSERSLDSVAFVTMRMAEGPESQVQLFPENRTSDFQSRFHRWNVSAAKAEIFGGRHRPSRTHIIRRTARMVLSRANDEGGCTFASPAPTTRQSLNS
jgi:hypothetical protein